MVPKKNSNRYLLAPFVLIIFAACILFLGTASFAESREESQTTQDYWETAAYENYNKKNIDGIAGKYSVEPEYLYYLVEVEQKFDLEPYELMALIARESEFRSITHMDGGSLSYNTTQMKLPTAQTAYMAITEYYKMDISFPTHELLAEDEYYAALLAGGYLRYLHDIYNDRYESYTAYRWGIAGRMDYYNRNGHFQSQYALKIVELKRSFSNEVILVGEV